MTTRPQLLITDSRDDDISAIQSIYAHHVDHGSGSFELEAPDAAEIARRRADVLRNGFPYRVVREPEAEGGAVLGFAYANFFRLRPAYRFSCENSIYVAPGVQRRGAGRELLDELIRRCQAQGLRQMIAVIGDSRNTASIGLHSACGFRFAGILRASGWKFDRWLDTVMMQRELGDGDRIAPPA